MKLFAIAILLFLLVTEAAIYPFINSTTTTCKESILLEEDTEKQTAADYLQYTSTFLLLTALLMANNAFLHACKVGSLSKGYIRNIAIPPNL